MNNNNILTLDFPPNLDKIWTKDFALQLAATEGSISALNQAVSLLHNPNLLMRPLLTKEAESSSRLEGTQASMDDVFKSAMRPDSEQSDDVREIINYQNALLRGEHIIKTRPLNQVVIRQIHSVLMSNVRGGSANPGSFRTENVWIGVLGTGMGEARYVPPDAVHIPELMKNVEEFMSNSQMHPLIACGLLHHRFEAIHPFKDGNGRTGRLLITLFLLKTQKLSKPMLYPSGFFEKNKDIYVKALNAVDVNQDWYSWLLFFLKAIEKQATISLGVASEIDKLFKDYKRLIQETAAHMALGNVLEFCFKQPYVTVGLISSALGMPANTVRRYITTLESKGILDQPYTIARGEKVYTNKALLEILRKI
ncbi:hypothetical protein A3F37_01650 [Candidatus Saccharibacteria bacterium RIFCSPHIGHO2_12_FULL_41_12]|nr:MAG: hypothetical protein A3F37_01650 [Candidatus Saccharibacteria bacterium RIFCSPHIGHO2_12_FULL_41_12]